jgi:hypothetical protein
MTVPLQTLHALGVLPERCIDCDSRRCVDFACRLPVAPRPTGTVLTARPVSTRQFSYDAASSTFSAEVSSTNGLGRVYADACDVGLTLVSSRTGRSIVFVVTGEDRDGEGDLRAWHLAAVGAPYRMIVWND